MSINFNLRDQFDSRNFTDQSPLDFQASETFSDDQIASIFSHNIMNATNYVTDDHLPHSANNTEESLRFTSEQSETNLSTAPGHEIKPFQVKTVGDLYNLLICLDKEIAKFGKTYISVIENEPKYSPDNFEIYTVDGTPLFIFLDGEEKQDPSSAEAQEYHSHLKNFYRADGRSFKIGFVAYVAGFVLRKYIFDVNQIEGLNLKGKKNLKEVINFFNYNNSKIKKYEIDDKDGSLNQMKNLINGKSLVNLKSQCFYKIMAFLESIIVKQVSFVFSSTNAVGNEQQESATSETVPIGQSNSAFGIPNNFSEPSRNFATADDIFQTLTEEQIVFGYTEEVDQIDESQLFQVDSVTSLHELLVVIIEELTKVNNGSQMSKKKYEKKFSPDNFEIRLVNGKPKFIYLKPPKKSTFASINEIKKYHEDTERFLCKKGSIFKPGFAAYVAGTILAKYIPDVDKILDLKPKNKQLLNKIIDFFIFPNHSFELHNREFSKGKRREIEDLLNSIGSVVDMKFTRIFNVLTSFKDIIIKAPNIDVYDSSVNVPPQNQAQTNSFSSTGLGNFGFAFDESLSQNRVIQEVNPFSNNDFPDYSIEHFESLEMGSEFFAEPREEEQADDVVNSFTNNNFTFVPGRVEANRNAALRPNLAELVEKSLNERMEKSLNERKHNIKVSGQEIINGGRGFACAPPRKRRKQQ